MSAFLSHDEIIAAIQTGKIKIAYYAIEAGGQIETLATRRYVKPVPAANDDDLDKKVREYFLQNLGPDSLAFHVGPFALVEYGKRGQRRKHVSERAGQAILDVAAAQRTRLFPFEFALIGTNEYIEVDGTIGGSLYSNVRNTDVGLSHVSTMVDPTWQGRLQIGITNTTRVSKEIRYLDPLCIVRFHQLSADTPAAVKTRFQAGRPHFGRDWWLAQQQPGLPLFPLRKEYEPQGEGSKQQAWEERKLQLIAWGKGFAAMVGIGSVVGLIATAVDFYRGAQRVENFEVALRTAQDDIRSLKNDSAKLQEILKTFHVLRSGSRTIRLEDKDTLTINIGFEKVRAPPITLVNVIDLPTSQYETRVHYNREADAERTLSGATITIRPREMAPKRGEYTVTWLVAQPAETT